MGAPCCSWSRTWHGPPGTSWRRLRNPSHLWGLPNLDARAQRDCAKGNAQLKQCLSLVRACRRVRVPVALGSPSSSWMWQVPPLARLLRRPDSHMCTLDFCAFGTRWRKRTRVQVWGSSFRVRLLGPCQGRSGMCSFSGKKKHIVLSGRDPSSGKLWTGVAEPYLVRFCQLFARALEQAIESLRLRRLRQLINCG